MIARLNFSSDVNVVREGSPSLILRVLLISLGITILPKSSTLRTIPVAFIFLSPFTILCGTAGNGVILSERQRVEESAHFRCCEASIRCQDPSTPFHSAQEDRGIR